MVKMQRWRIHTIDRKTGNRDTMVVHAISQEAATSDAMDKGYAVEKVDLLYDGPPQPKIEKAYNTPNFKKPHEMSWAAIIATFIFILFGLISFVMGAPSYTDTAINEVSRGISVLIGMAWFVLAGMVAIGSPLYAIATHLKQKPPAESSDSTPRAEGGGSS